VETPAVTRTTGRLMILLRFMIQTGTVPRDMAEPCRGIKKATPPRFIGELFTLLVIGSAGTAFDPNDPVCPDDMPYCRLPNVKVGSELLRCLALFISDASHQRRSGANDAHPC
jgi:hypothetical protein